jgi:hypothetical protein
MHGHHTDKIVVDLQHRIIDVSAQSIPLIQAIRDRFADGAFRQHLMLILLQHPLDFCKDRPGFFLPGLQ